MCRTVDHSLADDLCPARPKALDVLAKSVGDIGRSVWPFAQMCHGDHVFALFGCKPVKPNLEEALVEAAKRRLGCTGNIFAVDRRSVGGIPGLISPFLQEIGISMRFADDLCKRFGRNGFAFLFDGLADGFLGGFV